MPILGDGALLIVAEEAGVGEPDPGPGAWPGGVAVGGDHAAPEVPGQGPGVLHPVGHGDDGVLGQGLVEVAEEGGLGAVGVDEVALLVEAPPGRAGVGERRDAVAGDGEEGEERGAEGDLARARPGRPGRARRGARAWRPWRPHGEREVEGEVLGPEDVDVGALPEDDVLHRGHEEHEERDDLVLAAEDDHPGGDDDGGGLAEHDGNGRERELDPVAARREHVGERRSALPELRPPYRAEEVAELVGVLEEGEVEGEARGRRGRRRGPTRGRERRCGWRWGPKRPGTRNARTSAKPSREPTAT